jgi:hypothetical protein
LALPDYQNTPTLSAQGAQDFAVASYVIFKLASPERFIRLGVVSKSTPPMAMPEAAMDQDDNAVFGEYDIRAARQALLMEAKSVSRAVKK